jgi:acetylornithine deacetylase
MTEQMHANNEWVNIQDYVNSIKILAETIMRWCGVNQ